VDLLRSGIVTIRIPSTAVAVATVGGTVIRSFAPPFGRRRFSRHASAAIYMQAVSVVLVFPKCVATVDVHRGNVVIVTIRIPSTARAVATVGGVVPRSFAPPFGRNRRGGRSRRAHLTLAAVCVCVDALRVVLVFQKRAASVDMRRVIVTIRIPSTARAVATVGGIVKRGSACPFGRNRFSRLTSAAVCMDALRVVLVFQKRAASVDVRRVIVTIRIPSTARAVATVAGIVIRSLARPRGGSGRRRVRGRGARSRPNRGPALVVVPIAKQTDRGARVFVNIVPFAS
jgi:hypothetical protein